MVNWGPRDSQLPLSLLVSALLFSRLPPAMEAALSNTPPPSCLCDTDSPMTHVDIGIPANNRAKHSIGVLYWLLSAAWCSKMRGTCPQGQPWDAHLVRPRCAPHAPLARPVPKPMIDTHWEGASWQGNRPDIWKEFGDLKRYCYVHNCFIIHSVTLYACWCTWGLLVQVDLSPSPRP